ncbi:MAG: right-handed parallel beta-helix repeat-containing protein [Candidatus Eisenbacteria bacterium]|nr:right-handed parallel beta-helix repeat-containing protein [Candidatus Eisenbacteria bacterium]
MQAAPLPLLSSARRAVFTILVLFVSVPLIHSPAMGDVYQIRPDGTGDFPTIQAGIDGCGGGDVLELADGTFTGPGNWDANYHGKSITIRSRSGHPEACVVDCAGAHRGFHFLSHESPMAKLEGVTVANGTGDGSAIFCGGGARPTIRDCIFRDGDGVAAWYQDQSTTPTLYRCQFLRNTTVQHGGAIYWFGPTTYYEGVIEGCLFEGNRAKEYAGAIYLSNLTRATVRRCVFRENHAGWGGGAAFTDGGAHLTLEDCLFLRNSCDLEPGGAVLIRQEGYMDVTRCTFVGNRAAVGDGSALAALWSYPSSVERCIFASNGAGKAITWTQFASLGIECTDIFGNSDGDWIGALDGRQLTNDNLHVDPLFCDPEADDYRVSQISPCDSTNSPVCGRIGAFGRGCEWDVLTVRPDGSGDHPTIQAAIDAAADGAVILLADGTFSGDGNHDIELRGKRIRIRSESDDPAACTIDCRGSGPEPHRGFWLHCLL